MVWNLKKFKSKMPSIRDLSDDSSTEGTVKKWLDDISRAPAAQQVVIGSLSGWCSGMAFAKLGKVAALTIGGGLLLLQLAHHQGYIEIQWGRVERHMERAKRRLEKNAKKQLPRLLEEAETFVRDNVYLATSFGGGFLVGVATA